jgi:hypothetical protein
MHFPTPMSILCDDQRNTSPHLDDKYCTIRWPSMCILAAQVARNELLTRCVRNGSRGFFSKVIGFFKVKYASVLVQKGDLEGNVSMSFLFSKFDNSISYPLSYTDVIFVGLLVKHHNIH